MIKRYDYNALKRKIKNIIYTIIILTISFIVLITISLIFNLMILGISSLSLILIVFVLGIIFVFYMVKLEDEKYYLKVENLINDYEKNGRKQLALLYSLYLENIVELLKQKNIDSYIYLDLDNELIELETMKNNNKLRFIFKEDEVEISKLEPIFTEYKPEKIFFKDKNQVLEYILYNVDIL